MALVRVVARMSLWSSHPKRRVRHLAVRATVIKRSASFSCVFVRPKEIPPRSGNWYLYLQGRDAGESRTVAKKYLGPARELAYLPTLRRIAKERKLSKDILREIHECLVKHGFTPSRKKTARAAAK